MAVAQKIIKAIKVKMLLNRLSAAKENAFRELMGLPPKMSWYEECTSTCMMFVKDKLCQIFCPCCLYDRHRHLKRPSCWTSPTFREFLGFLGGIILTMLVYLVLVYQMDVPPWLAFTICTVAGFVLTLTMAFSQSIRCLVLLMLPQFFSGKGRMLLLIYALFLAMNHPLNNVKVNIGVMAQSATCGQEMALNETKDLIKSAVAPMQSHILVNIGQIMLTFSTSIEEKTYLLSTFRVMDSIKDVLSKLVDFANTMKKTYNVLKQTVMEIGSAVKRVGQWLASMVDRCNDKMGAPYRKCMKAFEDGVNDCRDKLGVMKFLCEIANALDVLCNIVRVGELLCLIVDAIKDLIEKAVDLPVQRTLSSAQEMFYFNVSIKYHFNYTLSQSKNYSEIKEDISKEIMSYIDSFLVVIRFFKNIMFITIIFILIKALIYRSRWLSDDRYDNTYITFLVRDLDERRKDNDKPGILPLNFDEEKKYIESVSFHMIPKEIKKLAFGLILFIISLFNAAFYLFCDFGLYSALHLIEVNFGKISKPPVPAHTKMHVAGSGPMADMYRSVIGMFDPLSDSSKSKVDVTPCVPHPSEPDWGVYKLIGIIYFICLILTITEAYGLRLRHMIMACYFPRRERKRAIWLFNHILKSRGGILDNARKDMKKSKMGDVDVQHISFKGRLAANFPICEKILKCLGWNVKSCLYCGKEGKPDDYVSFIHCAFFDCDAVYCIDCYADLDNICAVCNNAVEMKNSEDSEEIDSSIDERQNLKNQAQKLARQNKIEDLKAARRPSNRLANIRAEFGGVGRDLDLNSSAVVNQRTQGRKRRSNIHAKKVAHRKNTNNNACLHRLERDRKHSINDRADTGKKLATKPMSSKTHTYMTAYRSFVKHEVTYYLSDSEDNGISSGSSIDTEDLEFDYQYQQLWGGYEFCPNDDLSEGLNRKFRGHKLDLVSYDIFSDSSCESDISESSSNEFALEPISVKISRK